MHIQWSLPGFPEDHFSLITGAAKDTYEQMRIADANANDVQSTSLGDKNLSTFCDLIAARVQILKRFPPRILSTQQLYLYYSVTEEKFHEHLPLLRSG